MGPAERGAAAGRPRSLRAASLQQLCIFYGPCARVKKKKGKGKKKNSHRELQPPKVEVVALGQLYSRKPLKKKR